MATAQLLQQMPLGTEQEEVDTDIFMDLIRPAFKKDMIQPDVDAVLKRASIIVNTKNYVYYKLAAADRIVRSRMPPSMLTEEGGAKYIEFKRSGAMPNATALRMSTDTEQRFLARALVGDNSAPLRARWRTGALVG